MYQASKEHHWVTQTYMFPYKEDLCRFDFEVAPEDEYMCDFIASAALKGQLTPPKTPEGKDEEGASGCSVM